MNLSPFELLLIGIMIVIAIRVLAGLKGGGRGGGSPHMRRDDDQTEQKSRDEIMEQRRAEAYERARQAWGYLSSEPDKKQSGGGGATEPPPANLGLPDDFDYGDFMNGAKAM